MKHTIRIGTRSASILMLACWAAGCATVSDTPTDTPAQVTPAVSPSLAASGKYRLKRKVAIARFSNETKYGKSVLLDGTADLIAKQASDILSTRLAEANAFLLFERSDTTALTEALNRRDFSGLSLPADYLIVGSVTEFGRDTTGKTGMFSRTKRQRAYARVSVRLIDVRSGRVIFAREGAGESFSEVGTVLGVGTKAGYDSTLNDKAISAAISNVVGNVIENLGERPWRSYVLKIDGSDVIIGGGASQGIKVGDRFVVHKRGEQMENPQTGAIIEMPGVELARVEVTQLFGTAPDGEASRCKVVSGSLAGDPQSLVVGPDAEVTK